MCHVQLLSQYGSTYNCLRRCVADDVSLRSILACHWDVVQPTNKCVVDLSDGNIDVGIFVTGYRWHHDGIHPASSRCAVVS